MSIDWQPIREIFEPAQRFVISSHVRPDADAIGSELGLLSVLESLGKQVRIVNPSATPRHLAFLDPQGIVRKLGEGVSIEEALQADVHVVVDTGAWQQLPDVRKVLEQTQAAKVVIDHHVSGDDLGATVFKDVSAAATGVLITELAEFLNVPLSKSAAEWLYCAIATDTGWFRFPNTEARTMHTAARLIDAGAQPNILYRELHERSSPARLKLHAVVLDRVQFDFDGRLGHTFVLLKDFEQTGAHPTDTEDLVNDAMAVDGVECAFILVEQRSGNIKASLRSRGLVNVAEIAESFGGGGHRQAAGATIPRPFESVQTAVLEAFKTALDAAQSP
ncbi:MAG: bifunctional oligoribonuclease/PAP phosphatase NrnA [Planctomycetota bacterium]|nr:MAG: bifunctional oligoribonuclease/PAP phosphatase NrnA [Planctomycetota bacterium]REJ95946.1 MAG: bifunctional oligoribonuclease/PAP phosphatase NrnA [Planctomycetota bacterium]REK29235.1 MAG: bifunctional oligoribonuclease/PAP phosphatase NrnA [Planctomycetota bacterium]REK29419.1 MAG: bifunctional oligoribonuclease/PAP phosphatase NrnA [Planctomycetota bacterium]